MSIRHSKRFFTGGRCERTNSNQTNIYDCVLSRDDCVNGTNGGTWLEHSSKCDPNDMITGRCLKEDSCAVRASDCANDTRTDNFEPTDVGCSLQRDKLKPWDVMNPQFTQFGSCYSNRTEEHFCIYYPSDCDESGEEVYRTPSETLAANVTCDCSKVHVTACLEKSGKATCAAEPQSCDSFLTSLTPHQQRLRRQTFDNLDCILCKKSNTAIPTLSPTKSVAPTYSPTKSAWPTISPTLPPTQSPTKSSSISPTISGTKSISVLITAGIIGGVLAMALTLLLIYFMTCRKEQKTQHSIKREPPLQEISFSTESSNYLYVDRQCSSSSSDQQDV